MLSEPKEKAARKPRFRIKLRPAFFFILTLQAVLICVSSLAAVRVFYGKYRELLYQQGASILDTYTAACENRLDIAEKWSYNILSDLSLQEQMITMDANADRYAVYSAKDETEKLLTNYLFTIDLADSICYIANDGTQIFAQYLAPTGDYAPAEVERLRRLAARENGGSVWSYDLESGHLYLLRTIREMKTSNFSELGILVIACPVSRIFSSEFNQEEGYSPILQVADGGTLLSAGLPADSPTALPPARDKDGFVEAPSGRYYYTTEASPSTGWRYTCFIPDEQMLKGVNTLTTQIVGVILLVLAATLLLSSLLSGSITNRIHLLAERMDRVRKGKYDFPTKPKRRLYEIREIVELDGHFTEMADEIDYLINDVYLHELSLRDMRYQILQSQINPHFLYNTLETINNLARRQGEKDISRMVRALSKMLRSALSSSDLLSLREELELLDSYLTIQKIRYEERLDFSMEIPEDLLDTPIPKLTLQPLVENAINYGLEQFSRVCTIRLTAVRTGDAVQLSIADNGPGMDADFIRRIFTGEITPRRTGLGIKNVSERLRHALGPQSGLRFESAPGQGCTAVITLPCARNEEVVICPIV